MAIMRASVETICGWPIWAGTDGHLHARRPMTSPPVGVRAKIRAGGEGELAERIAQAEQDLADQIAQAEQDLADKTFWPKALAAREQSVDEMDLREWRQRRWDRLRPLL